MAAGEPIQVLAIDLVWARLKIRGKKCKINTNRFIIKFTLVFTQFLNF